MLNQLTNSLDGGDGAVCCLYCRKVQSSESQFPSHSEQQQHASAHYQLSLQKTSIPCLHSYSDILKGLNSLYLRFQHSYMVGNLVLLLFVVQLGIFQFCSCYKNSKTCKQKRGIYSQQPNKTIHSTSSCLTAKEASAHLSSPGRKHRAAQGTSMLNLPLPLPENTASENNIVQSSKVSNDKSTIWAYT